MTDLWISLSYGYLINNKSPKDESFVSVREEFVRPLGSRHSREARVRARYRRMRIEFKVIVRITSKARIPSFYVHTYKITSEAPTI